MDIGLETSFDETLVESAERRLGGCLIGLNVGRTMMFSRASSPCSHFTAYRCLQGQTHHTVPPTRYRTPPAGAISITSRACAPTVDGTIQTIANEGVRQLMSEGVVRYRAYSSYAFGVLAGAGVLLVSALALLVVGVVRLVTGATGAALELVVGGMLLLAACGLGLPLIRFLRLITLDRTSLRIPRSFSTVVVPTQEIAGVGMLFINGSTADQRNGISAWQVFVWQADGSRVDIPARFNVWRVVRKSGSSGQRSGSVRTLTLDLFQSTDFSALASSPAGTLASGLYKNVVDLQGPTGKLETLQLQKHPQLSVWEDMFGFWSPDGTTGHR